MIVHRTLAPVVVALLVAAGAAQAQYHDPATPPSVASKVFLTTDAHGIAVTEMRIQRKSDVLLVQADLANMRYDTRTIYYRFRWTDEAGNQVGDGESWKQMHLNSMGRQTIKSVAPSSAAADFQLEMSVDRQR